MKKSRIDTCGSQSAFASPFASLQIEGLPEGPELLIPVNVPNKQRKPGRVVLRREKAERGGKTVVVVSGFADHFSIEEIAELAREARQSCGCGGTVREREIELQGDNAPKVRAFFEKKGFSVAGV